MKQTKPFGMAYAPASSPAAEPTVPMPLEAGPAQEAGQAGPAAPVDLFNVASSHLEAIETQPPSRWKKLVKDGATVVAVAAALSAVYVGMRDSMLLASMLDQVSTEETVMVCKDGKVYYPDFSIMDRLLNRGRLVCTEWRVQRGYLSIPKP